jgi:serine/threonine-protein kinase
MAELLNRVSEALADRYDIQGEVGQGGMAVVYRAQDLKHRRQVAIKVLRPELAAAVGSERFLREIEIAAGLNHPNILPLHDSGEAGGLLFYVMPYVEGETLRDRLAGHSQLPLGEAVQITREVSDALGYAHAQGLVHRDVKPENILFQAGHALVADFGIARAISEAGGSKLTETGLAIGTMAYMSPEQAVGEAEIDARSDIYGLTCVLFEMLAGRTPFETGNAQAMLAQKVMGTAAKLADTRPELPPTLEVVVRRGLAKDPAERYDTAQGFATAVAHAITTAAIEEDTRRRRRALYARVFGGILVASLMVLAGVWISSSMGGPTIERIAVLPIADFTNTPDQAHLLEGMHQALISELQKAGITVIGRRGVLRYAGTDTPVREIAGHLVVDAVVDASLLRSGDSLAIQVGLIDGETEAQIWSEDFTEGMPNVLAIYRRVTRSIADEIRFAMTPEVEEHLAAAPRVVDPQVYDLILQGHFNRAKLTREGLDAAQRYYEQAIALDPNSAAAYAGLSVAWGGRSQMGLLPASETGPAADSAAARALELDPSYADSEVRYMRAVRTTWGEWDFDAGTKAFELALEADPNHAQATAYFAQHLHIVGRPEEGATMFRRALELDPDDGLIQALYGLELMYERRFEFAVERMEDALRVTPNDPIALATLRTAYHMTGQHQQAIDIWRRSYTAQGHPDRLVALERGWEEGGYSAALRSVAEFMQEQSEQGLYVTPYQIGTLYTRAGEEERALDFLEQAYEAQDPNVPHLSIDPIFDFMRENPRFVALIERLGLVRE